MKSFIMITVLAALTTLAAGTSIRNTRSAADGLVDSTMRWTGPSNGANITLHGTATEIMSQLQVLDPNWIPVTERAGYVAKTTTEKRVAELDTRDEGATLCCPVSGQSFESVNANDLQQAAQALLNIGDGLCETYEGTCSVAQCNNGAGIILCDTTAVTFGTFGVHCYVVGDYINDLISDCLDVGSNSGTYVCGQVFDTTGWNVIANGC